MYYKSDTYYMLDRGDFMVSKDKTSFLLNIDKTLKTRLTELATEDERSLTSYINIVLKNHVAKCKDVKESE